MHQSDYLSGNGDPEFMTSLARGLAVLRCFAERERPMTIAQACALTGLSRPAVRRCLHTLVRLGFAAQDGTTYSLRPKVLSLGHAFLSSSTLAMRAQPLLDQMRDDLHESCSLGVLEERQVYYIARAESARIMTIALRAGSRLPLYCTSMGRVLLAGLPRDEQQAYLRETTLLPRGPNTVSDPAALLDILVRVAEDGHAIVNQELEADLLSIAVPVTIAGQVFAAVNIGTQASRITSTDLRLRYLPHIRHVAREIAAIIGR